MQGLIQTIINGLLIGGIYALLAVGLTMVFGVLKIINFAQGEFLMLGMYLCWVFYNLFNSAVSPFYLIVPVIILMFFFGVMVMRLLVTPLLKRNDNNSYVLLTIGLSFFLQNIAQGLWSSNAQSINLPIKTSSFLLFGFVFPTAKVIAFCSALVLVFAIFAFLKNTDIGRAIRATSENRDTAQLLGIDHNRMYITAFAMGTAIAGIAGCLLIPMYSIYPRVGQTFSVITFAVVVLGGLGNTKGAFVSGLLIGIIETLTATYINSNVSQIVVFLVLIVVMLFRPNGLFNRAGTKL